jgi:hypothetical protein
VFVFGAVVFVVGAVVFVFGAVVFVAGVPLLLVGAAALVTGVVLGVDGCAGAALLVVDVFGVFDGRGVDGALVGALPEAVGVLAGVLGWPVTEVLGRLPVAEVVAPTTEERPSANAAEAPNAQRTARQVRRAKTPAGQTDERAQRRVITSRASDASKCFHPVLPLSPGPCPLQKTCPETFISKRRLARILPKCQRNDLN